MELSYHILRLFEKKRYDELEDWVGDDPKKAKILFQLLRSRHALQILDQALSPVKPIMEFAVKILGEFIQFNKGVEWLLPTPHIVTRGMSQKEGATIQKSYQFQWGTFSIPKPPKRTNQLEVHITKPFKNLDVRKNGRRYLFYSRTKNNSPRVLLKPGQYKLILDKEVIRLNIR